MQRLFKDRFFWYIGLLVVCTGMLTAFGVSVPPERIAAWSQVYIPIQRLAFSVAVLAASWRFGARGGWLVCLVGGIFILARHIPSLSQGFTDTQARDTLVELGLVVLGVLTSWFIGSYQRGARLLEQSERDLKQAEKEWRTTFDAIAEPLYILDRDYHILRVNQSFARLFHDSPQQFIGRRCFEVVHGTDKPIPECPHRKAMESRRPRYAEIYNSESESFWIASAAPIFNEQGEVTSSVHIIRDVTEHKKMQEQLIISDRLASLGEMAAGIVHEINNPLTGIIGFAELLREKDLSPEIRADVEIIYNSAVQASRVARNVLIFARKQEPSRQPVSVNESVSQTLALRAYDCKVNGIDVVTDFDPELPTVMADPLQLQQVFLNLVTNAEYFMKEAHKGGKLTITTTARDGTVCIYFADDGPGINKRNLHRLFDPFFSTKPTGKGTGLGLSICHSIITGHGGQIQARSEPGKGATFIIELPVSQESGQEKERTSA